MSDLPSAERVRKIRAHLAACMCGVPDTPWNDRLMMRDLLALLDALAAAATEVLRWAYKSDEEGWVHVPEATLDRLEALARRMTGT